MVRIVGLLILLLSTAAFMPSEEDRPNILFLVIEDSSPYLFPAYGNEVIQTPNLDWLAAQGVVFDQAFANAPYCSPARSSLISGSPATVYGNDIHREGHVQAPPYFLIDVLTKAGYYTANRAKTDYNIVGKKTRAFMKQAWSRNDGQASYNDSLRQNRPFFAQYNNASVHMSRLTTVTTENRLPYSVDTAGLQLPPHVPNLPAMKEDFALHLEGIQNIDQWVGLFLDDLRQRKLLDDTIIFFFADHGGCLPRGKAFPYDTGHRVPLIIYAPEKYQDFLPVPPGQRTNRLVSFDDFLPTALSLAGTKPPSYSIGQAFMGDFESTPRKYVHTFRTNTQMHFDPSRGVFDGKYHYIRFYTPYKIHALTQSFQWQMPSQLAWDAHFMSGQASPVHSQYYKPHPVEALYDLEQDPWELQNLAEDPALQEKLAELRAANDQEIRRIKDLGFLSWDMRKGLTEKGLDFYSWVRDNDYPLEELIDLAEKASWGRQKDLPFFITQLQNEKPSFRFWGITGLAHLAWQGQLESIPAEVLNLFKTEQQSDILATAAEILVVMGEEEKGLQGLMDSFGPMAFSISSLERLSDKLASLEAKLRELAEHHPKKETRIFARSLLIKQGKLPITELFEQATIDAQHRTYLNRVKNYMGKKP